MKIPSVRNKPAHGIAVLETTSVAATGVSGSATDAAMMARCIELSRTAVSKGEYPFGTVIALDGRIVAEGINSTNRDDDVTVMERSSLSRMPKGRSGASSCAAARFIPISSHARCAPTAFARPGSAAWSTPSALRSWAAFRGGTFCATTACRTASPRFWRRAGGRQRGLVEGGPTGLAGLEPLCLGDDQIARTADSTVAQEGHIQVQPAHSRSLWHLLHILFMRGSPSRNRSARPMARRDDL